MKSLNSTPETPNFNFILIGILAFVLIWQLVSCASGEKLVQRAVNRGYTIPTTEKLVPVEVIVPGKNGKDSIVTKYVSVNCPDLPTPKTWWSELQTTRQHKDSLSFLLKMYRDSLKYATRNNRIDSRQAKAETKSNNKTALKIKRQDTKQTRIAKGSSFWQRFKNITTTVAITLFFAWFIWPFLKQLYLGKR